MQTLGLKKVFKNGFISISFQGIPILIALVFIPLNIRYIGNELWGLYSLSITILILFNYLNFGVNPAVNREVATTLANSDKVKLREILSSGFFLNLIISFCVGLIVFMASPLIVKLSVSEESYSVSAIVLFRMMGLAGTVSLLVSYFRNVFEAHQKFFLVSILRATLSSILLMAPSLGYWMGLDLNKTGWIILLVYILVLLIYFGFYIRSLPLPSLRFFNKVMSKRLISFGVWVSGYSAINPLFLYFDRFLISSLLGLNAVTFYSTPYDLISRMSLVSGSLTAAFFPAISYWFANKEYNKLMQGLNKTFLYLSLILFVIALTVMILSPWLLEIWVGEEFKQNSSNILQVLVVGIFFNGLSIVGLRFLYGVGQSKLPFFVLLMELPLYMVVLFIFTQRFGLLGTAAAFSLRCCLDFFLLFVFSGKEMKKIGIMETFPLKLKLVLIAQALVIVALCGIFVLK